MYLHLQHSKARPKAVFYLVLLLAYTTREFVYFPVLGDIQNAGFALSVLGIVTVYPLWKSRNRWRSSHFEIYLLLLIFVLPLLTGYAAFREFGQPLLYGTLNARGSISCAGVIFIWLGGSRRKFTMAELERALIILAWGTAILYMFMKTFVNPELFAPYVGFTMVDSGVRSYQLNLIFVGFGILYYALLGLRTRKIRNYVYAILMYFLGIGTRGGRGFTAAVLFSFLILTYRWASWSRLLRLFPAIILVLSTSVGIAYAIAPTGTSDRITKFQEAIVIVFTGQLGQDESANARLFESDFALAGFERHPILGNGALSVRWGGGPEAVQGAYFSPGDVGLIGALWQFGLLGAAFTLVQFFYAYRSVKGVPGAISSPLTDGAKAYVLFAAISSIDTATNLYNPAPLMLFTAILFVAGRSITQPTSTLNRLEAQPLKALATRRVSTAVR